MDPLLHHTLERIENKVDQLDSKFDEHLLNHARDEGRSAFRKVLGSKLTQGFITFVISVASAVTLTHF